MPCELLSGLEQGSPQRGFESVLSRTGSDLLVDASKRLHWAANFLAPNSTFQPFFIHLIREPRGWYASERRRRKGTCSQLIDAWVEENLRIRSFVQRNKVPAITVFYDEIAQAPVEEFTRICHELGRTFHSSALRYWKKDHHSLAANGASFALLEKAPKFRETTFMVSGDDDFYRQMSFTNFSDQRWKQMLTEDESQQISKDEKVCEFLESCGRVLTAEGLNLISTEPFIPFPI